MFACTTSALQAKKVSLKCYSGLPQKLLRPPAPCLTTSISVHVGQTAESGDVHVEVDSGKDVVILVVDEVPRTGDHVKLFRQALQVPPDQRWRKRTKGGSKC